MCGLALRTKKRVTMSIFSGGVQQSVQITLKLSLRRQALLVIIRVVSLLD
jgi:hypothetical protein